MTPYRKKGNVDVTTRYELGRQLGVELPGHFHRQRLINMSYTNP